MASKFSIGQIVHHKRYGYRGVIFGQDPSCSADDEWYEGNQTQPGRDQPWYHVLVNERTHTTYVAESNLEADELDEPILHPLLDKIFSGRRGDYYYRESMN